MPSINLVLIGCYFIFLSRKPKYSSKPNFIFRFGAISIITGILFFIPVYLFTIASIELPRYANFVITLSVFTIVFVIMYKTYNDAKKYKKAPNHAIKADEK